MPKPQSVDPLKEMVKRFCRTDEAADNLVALINTHYIEKQALLEEVKRIDPKMMSLGNDLYSGREKPYSEGFRTGVNTATIMVRNVIEQPVPHLKSILEKGKSNE